MCIYDGLEIDLAKFGGCHFLVVLKEFQEDLIIGKAGVNSNLGQGAVRVEEMVLDLIELNIDQILFKTLSETRTE